MKELEEKDGASLTRAGSLSDAIQDLVARLITNAIVHYNTTLLSRVYEQKHAAGDHDTMALIAGMLPVAWQHINLFGSFEFSAADSSVDMDALAAFYADPNWWSRILRESADPTALAQTDAP